MYDWNQKSGKVFITSGIGFGKTKLAAFDAAELDAKIISTNAVKVSSFVPPGWQIINGKKGLEKLTDGGAFLPMAYAYAVSDAQKVAASVVIGVNSDLSKASIIAEDAAVDSTQEQSLERSESCIQEAFMFRNWQVGKLERVAVNTEPREGLFACALVAVLFFPG